MNTNGESLLHAPSLSKKPSCISRLRKLYPASYIKLLDMIKGRLTERTSN
jgi:hypothetical protein